MTVGLVTVTLFVYNMQRSCRQFYISCIVACRVVYTVGIYSVYAWSPLKFVHFNTSTRKYIFIIADELYSLVLIIVCRCCMKRKFHDSEKLLTQMGFECLTFGNTAPPLYISVELSSHWERCAQVMQFKCTRYSCDDLTLSVRIYSVSILFQFYSGVPKGASSNSAWVNSFSVDVSNVRKSWNFLLRRFILASFILLPCMTQHKRAHNNIHWKAV